MGWANGPLFPSIAVGCDASKIFYNLLFHSGHNWIFISYFRDLGQFLFFQLIMQDDISHEMEKCKVLSQIGRIRFLNG